MIVPGPTRIVLLHSGKYDYAEIELDRAVHLVAPNNVGKTTLIAALQFLYIDHANLMDFSYELSATRRYYFPDPYSFVLFECLTPKGYQVLGIHGQGPVQSFQYERFRYTGEFLIEDYLDEDRRSRRWEDVRARLATRDFALVQPRDLSNMLTGLGGKNARGTSFSIVPVRQRNGYERFRRLFTHLLKLGKLRQEDLKQVLIQTWEPDLLQREIDLEGGFRSQFEEVRRQREQVGTLHMLLPSIDQALEGVDARNEQREVLPALWAGIQTSAITEIAARMKRIEDEQDTAKRESGQAGAARSEAEAHNNEMVKQKSQLAVIDKELSKLDEEVARYRGYNPSFEDAAIEGLVEVIGELEHQLRAAKTERLADVVKDLSRNRDELERVEKRVTQLANLIVTAARQHMDDGLLARAFSLLNPEILGAIVGDGVEVAHPHHALAVLRAAAHRESDGSASIAGVVFAKGALRPANVGQYGDPAALRDEAERLNNRIRALEQLEQTLRGEHALREQLTKKKEEHQRRIEARSAYRGHILALEKRPELVDEHAARTAAADTANTQRKDAMSRAEQHDRDARAAGRRAEEKKRDLAELRKDLSSVEPPHWTCEPAEATPFAVELPSLFREYRARTRKEADADEQVKSALAEVERNAYDQYTGEDEEQTLANLRDAREALPERQSSLDDLWRSLVVGLKSAFKGLGEDLDTLHTRLNDLNRALAKTAVSNLDRLALRIERNRELGRYVKDVQRNEAMPLFGSHTDAETALERIGELLQRRSKIRLEDMFDLHFEITTPDGAQRKYAHLDRIESNGTTVTIKVLVSLHLLRALLTDNPVRIPFFLDEVASLDRSNTRGIVEAAEALGFCPILASPEASDAADVLYYLREDGNGRIVLYPESAARVEIRRLSIESGV